MEGVSDILDDVVDQSKRVLAEGGRLYTAIPGFVARAQQTELAVAIANSIVNKSSLIAEAGTGTGKTFAYLVPSLLSGRKAIISTATKTLQDQLFNKDLPTLIRALGLSVRVQNLKGRANYICHYRTELHAQEGNFATRQCAQEILLIHSRLAQLTEGVRSELPEIKDDSDVWPFVTSTTENCLGGECPAYQKCFLAKARKRALEAQVVVINHHLFFADSRLKDKGFGELLPGAEVVIFDEAHQLAEIASKFYGERLSTRQIQDLLKDTIREWPVLDLANKPLNQLVLNLERTIDSLLIALEGMDERVAWEQGFSSTRFSEGFESLQSLLGEFEQCFDDVKDEAESGLKRCHERLQDIGKQLNEFAQSNNRYIRWLERYKQSMVFNATPYNIADIFSDVLQKQDCCWVFTSATLTTGASFESFSRPLGIENAELLQLPSPFDFQNQAMLYLPRGMPDPKNNTYYDQLLDKAARLIEACQGRCFMLFTSHRALNLSAKKLSHRLNFPLLIQGEESKSILLNRFREYGNAVLLGTATFWEGVDVKGEALSCVIIDKLPFASPVDPMNRGRMAHLKSQGLSPFDELSLPGAILALKQGVGRLIRDSQDRGILMIADPRLTGRDYGKRILESLPPMHKTRDENKALAFIETLSKNESVSN